MDSAQRRRGREHGGPTVTERRGPPERSVALAADDEGHPRIRGRQHLDVLQMEEVAVERHRLAGKKAAQHVQRLGGAATARAHVDTAALDLARVFARDPDAEREPPRREVRQRRHLPGDGYRMAQRQLVDAHVQTDRRVETGIRRDRGQAVDAVSALEAHVVGAPDEVEAGGRRDRHAIARFVIQRLDREDPDTNIAQAPSLPSWAGRRLCDLPLDSLDPMTRRDGGHQWSVDTQTLVNVTGVRRGPKERARSRRRGRSTRQQRQGRRRQAPPRPAHGGTWR